MVVSARFERATPAFGGRCSIQLSYETDDPRIYHLQRASDKLAAWI